MYSIEYGTEMLKGCLIASFVSCMEPWHKIHEEKKLQIKNQSVQTLQVLLLEGSGSTLDTDWQVCFICLELVIIEQQLFVAVIRVHLY